MRSLIRSIAVGALLLAMPMAVPAARAQVDSREGIALQNQIYQLRAQLQALQDRGGSSAPAYAPPAQPQYGGSGDLVAQLLTRVDSLEDQVRRLRGRVDELQNQAQQQSADLGKRIDDLSFQVSPQNPRSPAPPPASSAGTLSPPPATSSTSANRTPEMILQDGNAALARRDFSAAETAARQVLANRTSPRAYDANLLLAHALAGERQYAQAAIAFDDTYNRSRKGSHAQEALLGLANALNAINEKKASCDTITRLRSEFPQMRPDVRDASSLLAQKANCR